MLGTSGEGRWFVAGILLGWLSGWALGTMRRRRRSAGEAPQPALTDGRNQSTDLRQQVEVADEASPSAVAAQPQAPSRTWISAQDLAAIGGIGPVFEQRLYNAGIGTYSQLAALSDAEVRAMVRPKPWQAFNYESWNEQARRLAEETGTVDALWNGLIPDDLSRIKGIGEALEQRLYEAGILTFADLAVRTVPELKAIFQGEALSETDVRDWIAQAGKLAEEVDKSLFDHGTSERSPS